MKKISITFANHTIIRATSAQPDFFPLSAHPPRLPVAQLQEEHVGAHLLHQHLSLANALFGDVIGAKEMHRHITLNTLECEFVHFHRSNEIHKGGKDGMR